MYTWIRRIPVVRGKTAEAQQWLTTWREIIEKNYSKDNLKCRAYLSRYGAPLTAWIFISAHSMDDIDQFYNTRHQDEQIKVHFKSGVDLFGPIDLDVVANQV